MKKPSIYEGYMGKFFLGKNQAKQKRSEKQARIQARKASQKGRPVTKENETRKTVKQKRTYQDIMIR